MNRKKIFGENAMTINNFNPAMLCDYYEFTMANGYVLSEMADKYLYFDLYFRKVPDGGGFAIAAGLEQVVEYIENLQFTQKDIEYLRNQNQFSEKFLERLLEFKFTGDIWAVPEGTPIFPNEPVMTIRAKAIEAQIVETFLLLCVNHQSLIATKANRIVRAAAGRAILEFGARRAQGVEAACLGARAAYIAGCVGTSNSATGKLFDVPVSGTMAHSWIQTFDDEYTAFLTYCKAYPNKASLLIDTYSVLKSGLPNAIRVFKELGIENCSVRIDSGDITYLSKKVREKLDAEGLSNCKIVASNSLDENIIRDIILQGGCVDVFGVGERLITAKSDPVFGGVYKLVAVESKSGKIVPKIKVSENVTKITTPHFKKVYRIYNMDTGKAEADILCLHDEIIDTTKPLTIFDPNHTWKKKTYNNYYLKELLVPVFKDGKRVYDIPTVEQTREHCLKEIDSLWDEVKRFENPHTYYVDLSEKLWKTKQKLLKENSEK